MHVPSVSWWNLMVFCTVGAIACAPAGRNPEYWLAMWAAPKLHELASRRAALRPRKLFDAVSIKSLWFALRAYTFWAHSNLRVALPHV